tara:strand:+ start:48521 stop:49249 length:729 start_codon:yes stop_codon:yes gene_type:complete
MLDFFRQNGFVNLGRIFSNEEVDKFCKLFDEDRQKYPYFWHPYGHHQHANYDALITSPKFDQLIRHPKVYQTIETLMGGEICFGEIGLRAMGPYKGRFHQSWHRDKPHWLEHPLRMDYIQLMVYLTDVSEKTHCFSISPESIDQPILQDSSQQLARGIYNLEGPRGTCALFNVSVLHTATTRPTKESRKTVQIYYGHRNREPLANDSGIPANLWRDNEDPEIRAFYSILNERTKLYMSAFGR